MNALEWWLTRAHRAHLLTSHRSEDDDVTKNGPLDQKSLEAWLAREEAAYLAEQREHRWSTRRSVFAGLLASLALWGAIWTVLGWFVP